MLQKKHKIKLELNRYWNNCVLCIF